MAKRILYLGLDPTRFKHEGELVHLPIITIVPSPSEEVERAFLALKEASHVLLTSRVAARLFFQYAIGAEEKEYICVGQSTGEIVAYHGLPCVTSKEPTAEGVVALLETMTIRHLFFPRSSCGRDVIPNYLIAKSVPHLLVDLYQTIPSEAILPELTQFDEIVFTSPSTVAAFKLKAKGLSFQGQYIAIGPVTAMAINETFY